MKNKYRPFETCVTNKPPAIKFVKIYFNQKGQPESMAVSFFNHYKNEKWKTKKGYPIKNWMTIANRWIWMNRLNKPLTLSAKLNIQFPGNIPFFYHGD